jgi:hypothetical protein
LGSAGVTIVCLLSIAFIGCGGGGSSDGGGGGTLLPANLDQSTAEIATALAMSTSTLTDFSDMWINEISRSAAIDSHQSVNLSVWALRTLREAFAAGTVVNQSNLLRAGSESFSDSCDSGTISMNAIWTGSDNPVDDCQISDLHSTLTMSNCVQFGEQVDGVITISISGTLCDPTSVSIGFNNLTYADMGGMQISSDHLDMTMAVLSGTFDNPSQLRATIDGDMSMGAVDVEFSSYTEELSISGSMAEVRVNGSLSGSCLDGWVTVTTITPIRSYGGEICPIQGQVQISGAGADFLVTMNSDGSMDIGDAHYDTCEDPAVPDSCPF